MRLKKQKDMRSKGIRFSAIIPMLALGIMFVLAACEDSKDLYNPKRVQEEAKKAFPVKDIDPNQTWETSAVCNASVSVNEKTTKLIRLRFILQTPTTSIAVTYSCLPKPP